MLDTKKKEFQLAIWDKSPEEIATMLREIADKLERGELKVEQRGDFVLGIGTSICVEW